MTQAVKIPKFYGDQVSCFLGGGFCYFSKCHETGD